MKTWKAHWDRQLYKALEHQYQMGLEALNENLPEIKVELTFAWVLLESHISKRWLLDADIIQYCTASFPSWLSAYCLIPDCTDWLLFALPLLDTESTFEPSRPVLCLSAQVNVDHTRTLWMQRATDYQPHSQLITVWVAGVYVVWMRSTQGRCHRNCFLIR